jgi:signal-transduction protein with cAMP-binding, CBS, and nucleotidyltransferase domain
MSPSQILLAHSLFRASTAGMSQNVASQRHCRRKICHASTRYGYGARPSSGCASAGQWRAALSAQRPALHEWISAPSCETAGSTQISVT